MPLSRVSLLDPFVLDGMAAESAFVFMDDLEDLVDVIRGDDVLEHTPRARDPVPRHRDHSRLRVPGSRAMVVLAGSCAGARLK